MTIKTTALGIWQADLIIRTAIIDGIADIRKNPWLLDYAFASLLVDPVTKDEYGQNEIDRAKEWFTRTEIRVIMSTKVDHTNMPAISIKLVSSIEDKDTLGDTHYDTDETIDSPNGNPWPALTPTFTPTSYDPIAGKMSVSQEIANALFISKGQFVVDKTGVAYQILEAFDETSFQITSGIVNNFDGSVIKSPKPSYVISLESSEFKETYSIGCHVNGEPIYLTYLHSIISFILLRYRERLLEGRGFDVSSIQSSDFSKNPLFDNELVFSRYIQLTGAVRNYWPKDIGPVIDGVYVQPVIEGGGIMAAGNEDLAPWIGDMDSIGKFFK